MSFPAARGRGFAAVLSGRSLTLTALCKRFVACSAAFAVSLVLVLVPSGAYAQDAVPPLTLDEPIAPFVLDARGTWGRLKQLPAIAETLDVKSTDLPTRGLGLVVGAHVYPVRSRNFALGLGGELLLRARGSRTVAPAVEDGPEGAAVVTRMTALSPQLSLNFGRRTGWSYLSGGIGWASFTSELEDAPFEDPESRPRAINYGGGARWFAKKHLAFSLDLRFYSIGAQEATTARPAFPRMTMMVFSAGVSVR